MSRNKTLSAFFIALAFVGLLSSSPQRVLAENEQEEVTKAKVRLSLTPLKNPDGSRSLTVTAKQKIDRKYVKVKGVLINLYLNDISEEGMQGSLKTEEDGTATFPLVGKFVRAQDSLTEYTFIASISGDSRYKDLDKSITIKEANLKLELIEIDSLRYARASLTALDSSGLPVPVEEAEVHFYIERMFSLLPFGGDYTYTDEYGRIEVPFPDDVPGDESGYLNIIIQIEEDEAFGTIMANESRDWGLDRPTSHVLDERQLWSSGANAPISLIITSLSVIGAIWGLLFYLGYQLFRVKKLGKLAQANQ